MNRLAKKVLLVGWDAADWKIIHKLVDDGEMPALQSIIENGVMGNISTLDPPFSPILWTSIATGKHADKHGILGFSEPTPDFTAIQPISAASRKVKAIWNILSQKGLKTHCINWWPSHPAEPINGIAVSNLYPQIKSWDMDNWPLALNAVHPKELHGLFAHLRVHPLELSSEHIAPFFEKDQLPNIEINNRIANLSKLIAEAASIQAAATLAMEHESWDFTAVYWETIDHFCHAFMNYHPPRLDFIDENQFNLYKNFVSGAYKLQDMMLGNLMKIAGEEATVMVISDHGFHSDHMRLKSLPNEPAGPASQHRDNGIFCIKGPNIKKDEVIHGTSLLDITPTLLTLFGLPIGNDMDGKPLTNIFTVPVTVNTIPSWETVDGNCGMLSAELRNQDPQESKEAIRQLIKLGYIEDPGNNVTEAIEKTVDELDYNLARVYLGTLRSELAIPILELLQNKHPHRGRYALRLINCYLNLNELESAKKLIDSFKCEANKRVLSKDKIESIKTRQVPAILENNEEKIKWINKNRITPIKEHFQAKTDLVSVKILEGDLLLAEAKPKEALKKYKEVDSEAIKNKESFIQMGNAYLQLKKWNDSLKMYLKALNRDVESKIANLGAGICSLHLKKYEQSLDYILTALSLDFYMPLAHLNLGRVLCKLKEYERAEEAFEIALKIQPNLNAARIELISLYETYLNKPEKASLYRNFFEINTLNRNELDNSNNSESEFNFNNLTIRPQQTLTQNSPIVVVSGLPRSGTSMVMQMLNEGGLSIYSDGKRIPDENNPKGYFEHEDVKSLLRNNLWLNKACGKAVKVVVPLLYSLPKSYSYKVIFIVRNFNEVIESQHRMLVQTGKIKSNEYAAGLEMSFKKALENLNPWIEKNNNVDIIFVKYTDIISNPEIESKRIAEFLKIPMNVDQMTKTVIPKLYRTKVE